MAKRKATRHTAAAKLESVEGKKDISAIADAFVVQSARTKHGPRRTRREIEFSQAAIGELFPSGPSPQLKLRVLTAKVNAWLAKHPDWRASGYGEVSRWTVKRALERYYAVNR
jgi:hypothetical protein